MSVQNRKAPSIGGGAAARRGPIFDAKLAGAHLKALKDAAGGVGPWWRPALTFEFSSSGLRKGNNNTLWSSITYRDDAGVSGELVCKILNEKQTGQIMPSTEEGVAKMMAASQSAKFKSTIKKREMKPAVQIQKWNAKVATEADEITVKKDDQGRPIYPSDDFLSGYFMLAEHVNEAFVGETSERTERGLAFVKHVEEKRQVPKLAAGAKPPPPMPMAQILESFVATNGPRQDGDIILSADVSNVRLRKVCVVDQAEHALCIKHALVATNIKVAQLVQTNVGMSSTKNQGAPLPNPLTRFTLDFEEKTGLAKTTFFDKSKPYFVDNKQKFEGAKVDNLPVDASNVHEFVMRRCVVDGIVDMSALCVSSMGISIPAKAKVLVVAPASESTLGLDDIYGEGAAEPPAGAVEPLVAEPPAGEPLVAEPPAGGVPVDYDALLV